MHSDAARPAALPPIAIQSHAFAGHGIQLAGDVAGPPDGQPVVLLHGGGQTRHAWAKALHDWAQAGFHVVSLDLRGHGHSDWAPDSDYSTDAMVSDLLAVIATLSRPPVLVGASLGGITSLLAIARQVQAGLPPPARALVLVDVATQIEPSGAEEIRAFMARHMGGFDTLEQAADAIAAYNPHRARAASGSHTGLMKNLRKGDDGRLYWHWDPQFILQRPPGSLDSMNERLGAAAAHVPVPVLLVRGQQSNVVSPQSIADLKTRIPHAQVVDIAGAGHMVVGDKNDAFNAAVLDFMSAQVG